MIGSSPLFDPEDRVTYSLVRPDGDGFWRRATCEEYGCGAYLHGWATELPPDDGRADYIRQSSGRRFTEERTPLGLVRFVFAAGQRCFAAGEHRVPIEREPLYLVRPGDPRQYFPGGRQHTQGEFWAEDFAEHQDFLATAAQRG